MENIEIDLLECSYPKQKAHGKIKLLTNLGSTRICVETYNNDGHKAILFLYDKKQLKKLATNILKALKSNP